MVVQHGQHGVRDAGAVGARVRGQAQGPQEARRVTRPGPHVVVGVGCGRRLLLRLLLTPRDPQGRGAAPARCEVVGDGFSRGALLGVAREGGERLGRVGGRGEEAGVGCYVG